ncbi:MAG: CapA family protein [Oscillospiraceae bacterium]|nr:CapA family protein [Oscillospiraceae bacterium]
MRNKRKRRRFNARKFIFFCIIASAVLILPTRFVVDGMLNSNLGEGTQLDSEYAIAEEWAASYSRPRANVEIGEIIYINPESAEAGEGPGPGSEPGSGVVSGDTLQLTEAPPSGEVLPLTEGSPPGETLPKREPAQYATLGGGSPVIGDSYSTRKYADSDQAGAGSGANGVGVGSYGAGARDLPPENIVITISAVGDCTIGYDETFGYQNRFDQVYAANGSDPAYFFANVLDIFSNDDITIANLENVFTESKKKADKAFRFKGPPEYVRILEEGNIEAVNLANNHMYDYFQKGYEDTIETIDGSTVGHFGYENYLIMEVQGIKVGLAGFHIGGGGWSGRKKAVTDALEALRAGADIVIVSFHWGLEGHYKESGDQRSLARYAIDNGADLVLGHHPHTLQPVETYNGRTIAYSLGNFCFGGNRNPKDKDSIILQQSFVFDGTSLELLDVPEPEIIPVLLSSVKDRNDYRPTPVEAGGADAVRILKKVNP